jgi:hypothetical protein
MKHTATNHTLPFSLVTEKLNDRTTKPLSVLDSDNRIVWHSLIRLSITSDERSTTHRELKPLEITLAPSNIIVYNWR